MTRGKGRLRLEAAVRLEIRLEGAIEGIVRRAKRDSLTHEAMLALYVREVHGHSDYSRLPQGIKSQIGSVWRGSQDALYATDTIVWVHRIDGEIVRSSEVHGAEQWARVESNHEWAHSGKPFGGPAKSTVATGGTVGV